MEGRNPEYNDCMESVDESQATAEVDGLSSDTPVRQGGNSLESPQTKQTKEIYHSPNIKSRNKKTAPLSRAQNGKEQSKKMCERSSGTN